MGNLVTDAVLPPAGWYEDPDPNRVDGSHRWWNGTTWTEHVRTAPQPAQPAAALSPSGQQQVPSEGPTAPVQEDVPYVPFASRRAAVDAEYPRRQSPTARNSQAFVGRGLSLLAVIVSIVTVIMLDVATHIPGQDWSAYVSLAGVVIAPGLAIAGIVFSAIGLARYRTRGNGGVAAAGLTLGILFVFAPFWIGLVLGIIAGLTGRIAS
ncbi:hypothetical protein ABH923_001113 [Leifsonia sp. EB41]